MKRFSPRGNVYEGPHVGGHAASIPSALLFATSMVCLALAIGIVLVYGRQENAQMGMAAQSVQTNPETGTDWDALLSQNPETVAWLSVEGTSIACPVVQPSGNTPPTWYLTHDIQGNPSFLGVPYLDVRCHADGPHLLVFGHHLGASNQMFSEIHDAYRQERFDTIGNALWTTPDGKAVTFKPLMAMSVDESYEPIQTFGFSGSGGMGPWLDSLSEDASATSADYRTIKDEARTVLTLCTCSSAWSGERARTLLIFAAG